MTNKVSLEDMRRILNITESGGPSGKEEGRVKLEDDGSIVVYDTTLEKLSEKVVDYATENMKPQFAEIIAKVADEEFQIAREKATKFQKDVQAEIDKTTKELLELANSARPIEIHNDGEVKKIKGVVHNKFETLLKITGAGQPVLLVGPAGTGKTHAAELVAESMGISFHSISVGSQTSKSDIQGYMTGSGTYVRTQFREAYEHGGLFLLDEADAGNSNVLILLNAALSNGYMAFPDGMVARHPKFRMVATANTFGNGASRQYVGRNQLDAATLDRFTVLPWEIDDKIEQALAGKSNDGKKWLAVVRAVRKRAIDELELRVVISPRATLRGAQLLASGLPFQEVLPVALTGNIPASQQAELVNVANTVWNAR